MSAEKNNKLFWFVTTLPWFILLIFSLLRYPNLISNTPCGFFSFWPYCGVPTTLQVIIRITLLVLAFGVFALQSWWLYANNVYCNWIVSHKRLFLFLLPAVAFFIIPFTSADTSFYFRVGNAAQHVNPYISERVTTNIFVYPLVEAASTGVMYGPITVQIMTFVAMLANGSYVLFLALWKFLLVVFSGLFVLGIARYAPKTQHQAILFALSPLLLWEWIAVGHFDVFWLVSVLLAYVFASKRQWIWVWPMLAIGVWLKFLPLLLAPWFLLWWWSELRANTWRRLVTEFALGAMLSVLLTYAAWAPYWTSVAMLKPLLLQSKWAIHTVFASAYYLFQPLAKIAVANNYHWWLTRVVHTGVLTFVLYLLWPQVLFVWRSLRHPSSATREMILWSMLYTFSVFLFVWQKSFWPWYALWPIALSLFLPSNVQKKYSQITRWLVTSCLIVTGLYQFGFHHTFMVSFTIISTCTIQVPVIYHLVKLRSYFPPNEASSHS